MGKGKKTGKIVFTIAGFALGGVGGAMGWWGNGVRFLSGAMYGMSIASTLWSVTQKPNDFGNLDGDYSQDDYSKFSTTTNDISQDVRLPGHHHHPFPGAAPLGYRAHGPRRAAGSRRGAALRLPRSARRVRQTGVGGDD